MAFENARIMFFNAFRDKFKSDLDCTMFVNSLKLSQSEIRLEVGINVANNIFTFGVTPNQASSSNIKFKTEKRLELQDSLCCNEYGLFVGLPADDDDGSFEYFPYGNEVVFGAAGAAAINGTFYKNGNFQVRCNNDVIAPYRGLYNHMYVGQTQQTAALGAASPMDQFRGAEDGFITSEPNLVYIGSKNYQPQIVLPEALASASATLRAVLIIRGILAQNSTVVN